jgi:hypothetical protein
MITFAPHFCSSEQRRTVRQIVQPSQSGPDWSSRHVPLRGVPGLDLIPGASALAPASRRLVTPAAATGVMRSPCAELK